VKTIEHSCMGKFRDMGNPAQVVKKNPAHTGKIFLYESLHKKHLFGFF
jgi:hypothetical protein